jgi:hypothetical protein
LFPKKSPGERFERDGAPTTRRMGAEVGGFRPDVQTVFPSAETKRRKNTCSKPPRPFALARLGWGLLKGWGGKDAAFYFGSLRSDSWEL